MDSLDQGKEPETTAVLSRCVSLSSAPECLPNRPFEATVRRGMAQAVEHCLMTQNRVTEDLMLELGYKE